MGHSSAVEQMTVNHWVGGSIPPAPAKKGVNMLKIIAILLVILSFGCETTAPKKKKKKCDYYEKDLGCIKLNPWEKEIRRRAKRFRRGG